MKKRAIICWILLSLAIVVSIIIIFNLCSCVQILLKPLESDNRPETLTLFITIFISVITGSFAYKQYNTLKMRDLLKMQKLINSLQALFNYHVNKLLKMNSKKSYLQLSTGMVITQDEIHMIYELEQLIYEHLDIPEKQEKKRFIIKTTDIILEMRELVYGLNSIYLLEEKGDIFPLEVEIIERAVKILHDIEEFRNGLKTNTDLKKIKGVA